MTQISSNFDWQNFFETTLNGDHSDSTLTINLTTVPAPSEGILIINPDGDSPECIFYTSKGATSVTCPADGRGWDSSSAQPWTSGTAVIMAPVGYMFRSFKDSTGLGTEYRQGWVPASGTWTYASSTTFTVPIADAGNMSVGTKIKMTNSGTKYFYVTSISGTTITITGGSDYTLANAAITSPFFSNVESPQGFPRWFNYTPTWTNITVGNGTLVGRFNVIGRTVNFSVSLVFGTTTSVTGSFPTATLPITASSSGRGRTQIIYNDNGVANYYGVGFISPSATTTVLTAISASGTYTTEIGVSSTVPFTFGNTDSAVIIGNYEI